MDDVIAAIEEANAYHENIGGYYDGLEDIEYVFIDESGEITEDKDEAVAIQFTKFSIAEYYLLGHVLNMINYNGLASVDVTVEGTWMPEEVSLVTYLDVKDGAHVFGEMTELGDGSILILPSEEELEPGEYGSAFAYVEAPASEGESAEGESAEGEAPAEGEAAEEEAGESAEGEPAAEETGLALQTEEYEITVGDVTAMAQYEDLAADSEQRAFKITFDGEEYTGKIDKGVWTADDPDGAEVIAAYQAAHEADPNFMGAPAGEGESAEGESEGGESADAESAGGESADAESAEGESADAESAGGESADAESAGDESADAESTGGESADAESTGGESASDESVEIGYDSVIQDILNGQHSFKIASKASEEKATSAKEEAADETQSTPKSDEKKSGEADTYTDGTSTIVINDDGTFVMTTPGQNMEGQEFELTVTGEIGEDITITGVFDGDLDLTELASEEQIEENRAIAAALYAIALEDSDKKADNAPAEPTDSPEAMAELPEGDFVEVDTVSDMAGDITVYIFYEETDGKNVITDVIDKGGMFSIYEMIPDMSQFEKLLEDALK